MSRFTEGINVHINLSDSPFFSATVYRKNINCSIDESIERFREVCEAAAQRRVPVRG